MSQVKMKVYKSVKELVMFSSRGFGPLAQNKTFQQETVEIDRATVGIHG